jgi:hypothetical protein
MAQLNYFWSTLTGQKKYKQNDFSESLLAVRYKSSDCMSLFKDVNTETKKV